MGTFVFKRDGTYYTLWLNESIYINEVLMFFHLNFFHEWNPRINNSKNKTKALDCFTVTIDCKIDTDY